MNYQQEYIRDEYLELKMPAGRGVGGEATFLLDPNHLHIWPRHSFMLIALPNKVKSRVILKLSISLIYFLIDKDKTFTCTLFAPTAELDRLNSADSILSWFKSYFPDAVRVIGENALVEQFLRNPRSPLICTKVILIWLGSVYDSNYLWRFGRPTHITIKIEPLYWETQRTPWYHSMDKV